MLPKDPSEKLLLSCWIIIIRSQWWWLKQAIFSRNIDKHMKHIWYLTMIGDKRLHHFHFHTFPDAESEKPLQCIFSLWRKMHPLVLRLYVSLLCNRRLNNLHQVWNSLAKKSAVSLNLRTGDVQLEKFPQFPVFWICSLNEKLWGAPLDRSTDRLD